MEPGWHAGNTELQFDSHVVAYRSSVASLIEYVMRARVPALGGDTDGARKAAVRRVQAVDLLPR